MQGYASPVRRQKSAKAWYVTKLVKAAQDHELDGYGNVFTVLAICPCGHVAEVPGAYAAYRVSGDAGLRERLKCLRCGRRGPRIECYHRPRSGA